MLELRGMQITSSLLSLPGLLWLELVALERVVSMDQIDRFKLSAKKMTC